MMTCRSLLLALVIGSALAFQQRLLPTRVSTTRLHAVELTPTLATPPTTFLKCVEQAVTGARKAMENGDKLMEVEFPPLPLEVLEDSASSARDIADANTRWAVEFAKSFTETLGQVTILYPDDPELQDAIRYVDMKGSDEPFPGVKLATHRADSIKNAASLDQVLLSIFGATSTFALFPADSWLVGCRVRPLSTSLSDPCLHVPLPRPCLCATALSPPFRAAVAGKVEAVPGTKMYIAVVSSTQVRPHHLDGLSSILLPIDLAHPHASSSLHVLPGAAGPRETAQHRPHHPHGALQPALGHPGASLACAVVD